MSNESHTQTSQSPDAAQCWVMGSALWDLIGRAPRPMNHGEDIAGRIDRIPGGVALNVALGLARLNIRPSLLSYLGDDADGDLLITEAEHAGIDMSRVLRGGFGRTDMYMAVEDPKGVVAALADALSLEAAGPALLAHLPDPITVPIVVDGNLTSDLLRELRDDHRIADADLRLVPASPGKVDRLAPFLKHPGATVYINKGEAETLAARRFASAEEAATYLAGPTRFIVTDGAAPAADCDGKSVVTVAPPKVESPQLVTGAGDRFVSAHLASEIKGLERIDALAAGVNAAAALVAGSVT